MIIINTYSTITAAVVKVDDVPLGVDTDESDKGNS